MFAYEINPENTSMETRKIGALSVSVVGLGCNNFGTSRPPEAEPRYGRDTSKWFGNQSRGRWLIPLT
jgi:hypothetical protein